MLVHVRTETINGFEDWVLNEEPLRVFLEKSIHQFGELFIEITSNLTMRDKGQVLFVSHDSEEGGSEIAGQFVGFECESHQIRVVSLKILKMFFANDLFRLVLLNHFGGFFIKLEFVNGGLLVVLEDFFLLFRRT